MAQLIAALFAVKWLNRLLGIISSVSGVTILGFAFADQSIALALNGTGAIAMAVILFQLSDLRERIVRLETQSMGHRK